MYNESMCYYCMAETMQGGCCVRCGKERGVRKPGSMALPLGTELDEGSIVLGEVIGEGGFGITYVGYDREKNRILCVKEFMPKRMVLAERSGLSPVVFGGMEENYEHALRSFIREAKVLNELQKHPNIVKAFFYLEENNTAYYGMELLHGKDLRHWLKVRNKPLSAQEACILLNPIMDALSFSHHHGILHRDISPNNIFLCDVADQTNIVVPKLIDYGAAYVAVSYFTQTFELVQTNGYTPVEQLLYGKDAQGPWVDVYAFCATLYYCITMRVPTASTRIQRGDAPPILPPSKFGADISYEAEQVLMKGLALRYEERIPNMDQFQREFCAACGTSIFNSISGVPNSQNIFIKEKNPELIGYLECIHGVNKGKKWKICDRMVLGRNSKKANIVILDRRISRIHCVIEPFKAGFIITDIGSANGTYVEQKRIPVNQPVWLKPGMIVNAGEHVFIFTLLSENK